jgi:hypothetical protein
MTEGGIAGGLNHAKRRSLMTERGIARSLNQKQVG